MFKVSDKNNCQLAERGTNKLIIKLNKDSLKATKVKPKEVVDKTPQPVVLKEKPKETHIFEVY